MQYKIQILLVSLFKFSFVQCSFVDLSIKMHLILPSFTFTLVVVDETLCKPE